MKMETLINPITPLNTLFFLSISKNWHRHGLRFICKYEQRRIRCIRCISNQDRNGQREQSMKFLRN